tara:strand:+ start:1320 stop:2411 length:1092 start_codon:yes stop_codon:yes gene_type:complete
MTSVGNISNNNNKGILNTIKNAANSTGNYIQQKTNNITMVAQNTANKVSSGIKNQQNSLKAYANSSSVIQGAVQSGKTVGNITKNFAENNQTISKVVFIIFIFILFGLLLRLGVYLLSLFVVPSKNPIIIDGMVNTNSLTVFQVNPSATNSKPILRSINENKGMEFSWNSWIFIENVNTGSGTDPKRFFSKGGRSNTELQFANDSPGLYLWDEKDPQNNTLTITMNTFVPSDDMILESGGTIDNIEKIVIKNVPIQKWVNVTIRVQEKTIDVYINGVLSRRQVAKGVIRQNYGDIYVGDSLSGPAGLLSSLRYYSYAIGNNEIQMIMNEGPNLKMVGSTHEDKDTTSPYLASRWYLDNIISDN